jgi:hypothetical protein
MHWLRFRAEKYGVPYFLAESEAIALRPTERGRRSKSAERGRGFKCTGYPQLFMGCSGEPQKTREERV